VEGHLFEFGLHIGFASCAGFINFLSDRFGVHGLDFIGGCDLPSRLILELEQRPGSDQDFDIVFFRAYSFLLG
jgi:hypothetical protein